MSEPTSNLPNEGSLAEIVAGLCRDVGELKAWRAAKKWNPAGSLQTRPDRPPFGWKVHPHNPKKLTADPFEQKAVLVLIELRQNTTASLRSMARELDRQGFKRRNGKKWADGGHTIIKCILKCAGAATAEDARRLVADRIRAQQTERAAWPGR